MQTPPSYFPDPDVDDVDDASAGDGWEKRAYQRLVLARRRALWHVAITLLFFATCCYFLYRQQDDVAYALLPPQPASDLGDVSTLVPENLVHNTYVTVHGITEHRGFSQEIFRGLEFSKHTYWYFRLLGSRGIFVEVPADADRYGFTQEVTVTGRVIDPARHPLYGNLLKVYQARYPKQNHWPTARVVQANISPGVGKMRYGIVFSFLALMGLLNIVSMVRLVRIVRRSAAWASGGEGAQHGRQQS